MVAKLKAGVVLVGCEELARFIIENAFISKKKKGLYT